MTDLIGCFKHRVKIYARFFYKGLGPEEVNERKELALVFNNNVPHLFTNYLNKIMILVVAINLITIKKQKLLWLIEAMFYGVIFNHLKI